MKDRHTPRVVFCPYCYQDTEVQTGAQIYPHRLDLRERWYYVCVPCDARVGCHRGTLESLGRPANAALRRARLAAHAAFDQLWLRGQMTRGEAYAWLSQSLGLSRQDCHIGLFDSDRCQQVLQAVRELSHDPRD